MTARVPVRPDLADVVPYGAPQLDVPVRLNTNETAEPPPPAYLEAVAARIGELQLHRYPDRPATALRQALADRFGLTPDRVWAANGSNEVLLQLFQAYGGPGRSMLLFRPGYSAHPLIARVASTAVVEHDLPADLTLDVATARDAIERHDPDLVVVASPNNPTGIPVEPEVIRSLHDHSRALVIVDEAYVEFGTGSALDLLDTCGRLVVSRTFSKAFRLAGLRLGYLLGHDWVIDDIRRVRLPYHLDALKQTAALVALEQADTMLTHLDDVAAERDRVAGELASLAGVEVWPSAANFLLFRTTLAGIFERLLARGVLIRDFSDKPRLEGCVRVTIGTPEENDTFLRVLRAIIEEAEA